MSENFRWTRNAKSMGTKHSGSMFKGKGDMRNCSCHRPVKFIEHGIVVVEMVLEKRHHRTMTFDEMQFGFMPERKN